MGDQFRLPLNAVNPIVLLLLLLGCSPSALIEQTNTPEEGNRDPRVVPEVFRTEWLCVWITVDVLMGRETGTLPLCGV